MAWFVVLGGQTTATAATGPGPAHPTPSIADDWCCNYCYVKGDSCSYGGGWYRCTCSNGLFP